MQNSRLPSSIFFFFLKDDDKRKGSRVRDSWKALIVQRNNSTCVRKKRNKLKKRKISDHLTPRRWQPLEVTACRCLCACVWKSLRFCLESAYKGMFLMLKRRKEGEEEKPGRHPLLLWVLRLDHSQWKEWRSASQKGSWNLPATEHCDVLMVYFSCSKS